MKAPFAPPFLASEPRATALLSDGFRRKEAWRAEVQARREQRVAAEVLTALERQQRALGPSPARERNVEALSQAGTVAVVSGQQTGLFLGPLYTFYKAATAVVWARALEAETGARCVPVFWLQTEDHDFAEIASCEVPPALRLTLPDAGARCSVAHRTLPQEVDPLVAALSDALAAQPFAAEILEPLREAYVPGRPVAQAFAMLLGRSSPKRDWCCWIRAARRWRARPRRCTSPPSSAPARSMRRCCAAAPSWTRRGCASR